MESVTSSNSNSLYVNKSRSEASSKIKNYQLSKATQITFNLISRYKIWIIAFWVISTVIAAFFAMDLMNATVFIITPPDGYDSDVAYDKMGEYFHDLVFTDAEIIVISLKDHKKHLNIDNNLTAQVCNALNQSLYNLNNKRISSLEYYYQYTNISEDILEKTIKPRFVDPAGNIMLFIVTLDANGVSSSQIQHFIDDTKDILDSLADTYAANDYNFQLTGWVTMGNDCIKVITKDIKSTDMFLVPVMLLFMITVIGSYKLVLLPFLCFGMVICISFALFDIIAQQVMDVSPESPPFMLFVSMAICVDYGMFLLSRFITGIQIKKLSVDDAVKDMLQYSGHVIVLSGSILILLEIGFGLFFPGSGLDSASYAIAMGVFFSITVSITVTTSLLLLFPNFFSDIRRIPKWMKCCCKKEKNKEKRELNIIDSIDELIADADIDELADEKSLDNNFYFKLGQTVTSYPWKCVFPLLIYACMSPVLYQLVDWQTTMSPDLSFPTEADSVSAYSKIKNNFKPGVLQPITILSVPNNAEKSIWNPAYFDDICALGNALIIKGYTNNTDMSSFVFTSDAANVSKINCFRNVSALHSMVNNQEKYHSSFYQLYFETFNSTVNTGQNASLIQLTPSFDPFSDSAQKHADKWRDFIQKKADLYTDSMDIYVHSEMYWQIDLLQMEYDRLPLCLIVMLSLIFILIGIAFKSIFLPFRLLMCIVIPIMFVYGLCTGVYNKGWLNWTKINGYKGLYESGGLVWATPILSLSLLLGLALDYEIFLYSRVFEYRSKYNYTTRASIILAISTTGPVISSAGICMTLAFAGFLLESIPSCAQFGFIFVVGVLVDTFIIRPILVPSILSFADYWNWYPTIMPNANLKNEYHQIIIDDSSVKLDQYSKCKGDVDDNGHIIQ